MEYASRRYLENIWNMQQRYISDHAEEHQHPNAVTRLTGCLACLNSTSKRTHFARSDDSKFELG